jgi:hypothetical protein
MANITKIHLTDLEYYDTATSAWVDLCAVDEYVSTERSLGPRGLGYRIILFNNPSTPHHPPRPFSRQITWNDFEVEDPQGAVSDSWTIFANPVAEGSKLILDTTPSVKIRYKLHVEDDSDPMNAYSPDTLYYQIISAQYPADHITYTGVSSSQPFIPTVNCRLPGISNTMVAGSVGLFSWFTRQDVWQLKWIRPDLSERTYGPTSVSLTTWPAATGPYGGAMLVASLVFPQIQLQTSGTHVLELSLIPNDIQSGGEFWFADNHTWTATLTAYTPGMDDPLVMSFDKIVFMEINFTPVPPA